MDFSFSEIAVIVLIAFVVLGPEKFVEASHQLGVWLGKVKTQLNNFKVMAREEVLAEKNEKPPESS